MKVQLNLSIKESARDDLKSGANKLGMSMASIVELGIYKGLNAAYSIHLKALSKMNEKLERELEKQ